MSMTIYAVKISRDSETSTEVFEPVLDFDCADPEILAPDAEARSQRGEDVFLPNPRYVPNAFMTLANANAIFLFAALGFDIADGADVPIEDLEIAVLRMMGNSAGLPERPASVARGAAGATIHECALPAEQMQRYLDGLLRMSCHGRHLGATHIVVV